MKLIGLIGYPLAHSISPVFQQEALDHLRIDARYELWETEHDALAERVAGMRNADCLGANVTVPYKELVVPLLDEVDPLAGRIGAVNTIVNRDGRLSGYNTDMTGFARALREEAGFDPSGAHVVLLGAGGAGRAVTMALVQGKAASVTITDILPERAQTIAEDLGRQGETVLRNVPAIGDKLASAVARCQLLVNCTPIGMRHSKQEHELPIPSELIPAEALVLDIIYNPFETRLLAEAKKRGARTLGGLSMLVYQGAASFELWTGAEAPVDVMNEAARKALGPATVKGSED
ncbi:MAG: shikimate dehydrogenase [Dehalococcoidia bacterium]|nr:MAG: shikimate dehydrogenase [Dehalococcoidia bacterium]